MSEFPDFDAARTEPEPIRFTMCGKQYAVPSDPPADAVLRLMSKNMQADPSEFEDAFAAVVGAPAFFEMRENGMTWSQFMNLANYVMEEISKSVTDDEVAEGNGSRSPTSLGAGER